MKKRSGKQGRKREMKSIFRNIWFHIGEAERKLQIDKTLMFGFICFYGEEVVARKRSSEVLQ